MTSDVELVVAYWTVSGPVEVHIGREWSLFDWADRCAEAAWKAKYGHIKGRAAGPAVVKLYMRHLREAVKKLTGKEFKSSKEFKAWLDEHAEEVGLKPKKPAKRRR